MHGLVGAAPALDAVPDVGRGFREPEQLPVLRVDDALFDEEVEPLFLATGPSLTGDCEEDVPGAIVRRTLPDDDAAEPNA